MAKVIVERPRTGGGIRYPRGSTRGYRRMEPNDLPRREGIKRPWARTSSQKWLNENLAPLRRYLLSNVGRPWDKVFSEISERIVLDSAVQLHIWQHVEQYVCFAATRVGREYVDSRDKVVYESFLVDARTGLLRKNEGSWPWRADRFPWPQPDPDVIAVDERRQYRRIDDIWYVITLEPLPLERTGVWDVVHRKRGCELRAAEIVTCCGRDFYCAGKRQL